LKVYLIVDNVLFQVHRRIIGDELANQNAGPLLIDYIKILTMDGSEYPVEG